MARGVEVDYFDIVYNTLLGFKIKLHEYEKDKSIPENIRKKATEAAIAIMELQKEILLSAKIK